jgi:hypothetical protein
VEVADAQKILTALFALKDEADLRVVKKVNRKALFLRVSLQLFTLALLAASLLAHRGLPFFFATAAGLLVPTAVLCVQGIAPSHT